MKEKSWKRHICMMLLVCDVSINVVFWGCASWIPQPSPEALASRCLPQAIRDGMSSWHCFTLWMIHNAQITTVAFKVQKKLSDKKCWRWNKPGRLHGMDSFLVRWMAVLKSKQSGGQRRHYDISTRRCRYHGSVDMRVMVKAQYKSSVWVGC